MFICIGGYSSICHDVTNICPINDPTINPGRASSIFKLKFILTGLPGGPGGPSSPAWPDGP